MSSNDEELSSGGGGGGSTDSGSGGSTTTQYDYGDWDPDPLADDTITGSSGTSPVDQAPAKTGGPTGGSTVDDQGGEAGDGAAEDVSGTSGARDSAPAQTGGPASPDAAPPQAEDVQGSGPGANPSAPDQLGDASREEIRRVVEVSQQSDRYSPSDLTIEDGQIRPTEEAVERERQAAVAEQAEQELRDETPTDAPTGREPQAPATAGPRNRRGLDVDLEGEDVTATERFTDRDADATPTSVARTGPGGEIGLGAETGTVWTLAGSGREKVEQANRDRAVARLDARTPGYDIDPEDVVRTADGYALDAETREALAAVGQRAAATDEQPLAERSPADLARLGYAQAAQQFADTDREDLTPGTARSDYQRGATRFGLRSEAADVYSEQLGFDVPASAVDIETVTRDGERVVVPTLDAEAAKAAGRRQGDIFSGAARSVEDVETAYFGAFGVDQDRVADQLTASTPITEPRPGSIVNVRRVEEMTGENEVTGELEGTEVFGVEFGEARELTEEGSQWYRRTTEPASEGLAWWLRYGNPVGWTATGAEKGIRAATGTQTDQPLTGQYASGISNTIIGFGNIPEYPGVALTAADVGATGVERIREGEGAEFAGAAAGAGSSLAARATQQAAKNPARTGGSVAAGYLGGLAASRLFRRAARPARDRLRTVGGTKVDTEDLASEEVVEFAETGGESGEKFPGAADPDLYRSDPAEAVVRQSRDRTPEEILDALDISDQEGLAALKKALDVEPEGPGSGRAARGLEATPDETGIDPADITEADVTNTNSELFAYENPGAFQSPELSPYFLGAGTETPRTSLVPGFPTLGGKPTGVIARAEVEAPDADTQLGFAREMARREGESTTRTKPAGSEQLNPAEIETVAPPGATFSDVGGGPVRNVLRRAGIGSDFYTTVQGRRVPIRLVVADSDAPDTSRRFGFGDRGQAEVDIGDGRVFRSRRLDEIGRRGRNPVDRPIPLVTAQSGARADRQARERSSSRPFQSDRDRSRAVASRDGRLSSRSSRVGRSRSEFFLSSAFSPTEPLSEPGSVFEPSESRSVSEPESPYGPGYSGNPYSSGRSSPFEEGGGSFGGSGGSGGSGSGSSAYYSSGSLYGPSTPPGGRVPGAQDGEPEVYGEQRGAVVDERFSSGIASPEELLGLEEDRWRRRDDEGALFGATDESAEEIFGTDEETAFGETAENVFS